MAPTILLTSKADPMITDACQLAHFITQTLAIKPSCRVFCDVLERCWSSPATEQDNAIKAFAEEHNWDVKIHEPGAYGRVVDFSPLHHDLGSPKVDR